MRERRIPPHEVPRIIDSPFQRLVAILNTLFSRCPQPRVRTEAARASGELLGRHLLNLLGACGELNVTGYHSVAVTLLRPLEDALDLLAAVTMAAGAAERWQAGDLKASEAAKLWVERAPGRPITGETFVDYRKRLRSTFNPFSHCAPLVPQWDLFAEAHPIHPELFRLRVNHERYTIVSNGHRVDAFLVAHLWEVLAVVRHAFRDYLESQPTIAQELSSLEPELERVLAEHHSYGLLDTIVPPELESLSVETVQQPLVRRLPELWEGSWSCGAAPRANGRLALNQHGSWLTGDLTIRAASESAAFTITERLSGAFEGTRLLLDGIAVQVSPPSDIRYALDSFDLTLSDDGAHLAGGHSCDLGTGDAGFVRVE